MVATSLSYSLLRVQIFADHPNEIRRAKVGFSIHCILRLAVRNPHLRPVIGRVNLTNVQITIRGFRNIASPWNNNRLYKRIIFILIIWAGMCHFFAQLGQIRILVAIVTKNTNASSNRKVAVYNFITQRMACPVQLFRRRY